MIPKFIFTAFIAATQQLKQMQCWCLKSQKIAESELRSETIYECLCLRLEDKTFYCFSLAELLLFLTITYQKRNKDANFRLQKSLHSNIPVYKV